MEKCTWEPSGLEDEQPDPYTPTPGSRPGDEQPTNDQHDTAAETGEAADHTVGLGHPPTEDPAETE